MPLLSVALEALDKGHDQRAAARRVTPLVVLLLVGQPLFFTWHPDGQQIVAVRTMLPYGLDLSHAPISRPKERCSVTIATSSPRPLLLEFNCSHKEIPKGVPIP